MSESHEPGGRSERLAASTSVLYRSQIEIARILQGLASKRTTVSADVEAGEQLFLTRILHVDPGGQFFLLDFSGEKRANIALLAQRWVIFCANLEGARIEFSASEPSETVFDGVAAVRFAFPPALISSQRREYPRVAVSPTTSLRCIADSMGVVPFEARIVDISRGGMGTMTYDPEVKLPAGAMLKRSRIMIPGGESILADLEVRYTISIQLPDGSLANRSGVRFLNPPREIQALIDVFVLDLDQKTGQ